MRSFLKRYQYLLCHLVYFSTITISSSEKPSFLLKATQASLICGKVAPSGKGRDFQCCMANVGVSVNQNQHDHYPDSLDLQLPPPLVAEPQHANPLHLYILKEAFETQEQDLFLPCNLAVDQRCLL